MHNVKYCDDVRLLFSLWMCHALVIIIPGIRMDWGESLGLRDLSRKLGLDLLNCIIKWIKQKHYFYLRSGERMEKEIFRNSDTFCAASLFVDPARELFDGGKTDNPFQFCWKQFLQMDLNFSENTSRFILQRAGE